MKCDRKRWFLADVAVAVGITFCCGSLRGEVVDFEDLVLEPETAWNGADGSGGFTSGGMTFGNLFTAQLSSKPGELNIFSQFFQNLPCIW